MMYCFACLQAKISHSDATSANKPVHQAWSENARYLPGYKLRDLYGSAAGSAAASDDLQTILKLN
jgi:hypothetical protein